MHFSFVSTYENLSLWQNWTYIKWFLFWQISLNLNKILRNSVKFVWMISQPWFWNLETSSNSDFMVPTSQFKFFTLLGIKKKTYPWDSLLGETPTPGFEVGRVVLSVDAFIFYLCLFSLIFFTTFPLFSNSPPQSLSCSCLSFYLMTHSVSMAS